MRITLGVVERSLSGLETFSTDSQETLKAEDLPVPRCFLDAHIGEADSMDIDPPRNTTNPARGTRKHHSSDSGIGSTVTGSDEIASKDHAGMGQVLFPSSLQIKLMIVQPKKTIRKRPLQQ